MSKGSPFYIQTHLGKLQLTKGTYLTLQKRHSTLKTIAKTKSIVKHHTYSSYNKPTVKRCLRSVQPTPSPILRVGMMNKAGNSKYFPLLAQDNPQVWRMMRSLPSIDMQYDNDEASEQGEIEGAVSNMAMSLAIAVFDHHKL